MKIIIVGAGVSGLSTYLQLRKILPGDHQITIYESHRPKVASSSGNAQQDLDQEDQLTDAATVVGNVIGLPPQTVRLLKEIDPKLYDVFISRGYRSETYLYRTARGHTIALHPASDEGEAPEHVITCPRQNLWKCLLEVVGEEQVTYRKIVRVNLDGDQPKVLFADGKEQVADLVIGADGVRSVVKRALFGKADEDEYKPHFEGLRGMGGFIETDIPDSVTANKSMVFTLGPAGSFGYCSAAPQSQRSLGWWFTWGTANPPEQNVLDIEACRHHLKDRCGTWTDPVIQEVLEKMSTDRVYPIWTTPELPYWGSRSAVLLGDAAHTVQATSGLGAALSLEDSIIFTSLLAHYLKKSNQYSTKEAIELASKGLYDIQKPKAANIQVQTRRRLVTTERIESTVLEYMMYIYVYLWTNFSVLTQLVVGGIVARSHGKTLEEEVVEYLGKSGLDTEHAPQK